MCNRQFSWGDNWEKEIRMHYNATATDSESSDSEIDSDIAEALLDAGSDASSD
jgi:hypothetical protein